MSHEALVAAIHEMGPLVSRDLALIIRGLRSTETGHSMPLGWRALCEISVDLLEDDPFDDPWWLDRELDL